MNATQLPDSDAEYDILLDHEYDGIREYDNPLPGWWVGLFWLTIIFSVIYMMWFHMVGADYRADRSVLGRYQAELAAYAAQLLETYGDLTPDVETILAYRDDGDAMLAMGGVFKSKCAQCHAADATGATGPNLTDRNWIDVREVTDIARTIVEGRPTKGMPAWGDRLTPTEVTLLSAYVAQLSRNPAPGKAPQGTELPDWDVIHAGSLD